MLDKRAAKKREKGEELEMKPFKERSGKRPAEAVEVSGVENRKRKKHSDGQLDSVLSSIF